MLAWAAPGLRAAQAEPWVKLVAPDFTVITPLPE
jgi:hypothetical protein